MPRFVSPDTAARFYGTHTTRHVRVPRHAFLYYVHFVLFSGVPAERQYGRTSFGLLVHRCDRPKVRLETDVRNQYNRKRLVTTGVAYDEITMVAHDTPDGPLPLMVYDHLRHHIHDFDRFETSWELTRSPLVEEPDRARFFGPRLLPAEAVPFLRVVRIYEFGGGLYNRWTLWYPRLVRADFGDFSYAAGGDTVSVTLTLAFEGVTLDVLAEPIPADGRIDDADPALHENATWLCPPGNYPVGRVAEPVTLVAPSPGSPAPQPLLGLFPGALTVPDAARGAAPVRRTFGPVTIGGTAAADVGGPGAMASGRLSVPTVTVSGRATAAPASFPALAGLLQSATRAGVPQGATAPASPTLSGGPTTSLFTGGVDPLLRDTAIRIAREAARTVGGDALAEAVGRTLANRLPPASPAVPGTPRPGLPPTALPTNVRGLGSVLRQNLDLVREAVEAVRREDGAALVEVAARTAERLGLPTDLAEDVRLARDLAQVLRTADRRDPATVAEATFEVVSRALPPQVRHLLARTRGGIAGTPPPPSTVLARSLAAAPERSRQLLWNVRDLLPANVRTLVPEPPPRPAPPGGRDPLVGTVSGLLQAAADVGGRQAQPLRHVARVFEVLAETGRMPTVTTSHRRAGPRATVLFEL